MRLLNLGVKVGLNERLVAEWGNVSEKKPLFSSNKGRWQKHSKVSRCTNTIDQEGSRRTLEGKDPPFPNNQKLKSEEKTL